MPVKNIKVRVDRIEQEQQEHRQLLGRHQLHIDKLEHNVNEIRVALAKTATKEDVLAVGTETQTAINGILRDALNTAPEYAVVAMTQAQVNAAEATKRAHWIMAICAVITALLAASGITATLWPHLAPFW